MSVVQNRLNLLLKYFRLFAETTAGMLPISLEKARSTAIVLDKIGPEDFPGMFADRLEKFDVIMCQKNNSV